jgi:hypothetical protein
MKTPWIITNMKQGTKANKSGLKLESQVENLIIKNLKVDSEYASRYKSREDNEDILLKNVPYTNIYGNTKCRSEFVLCYKSRKVRIECKTQHSAGSVDEKLPYLYMNFTQTIPESEAIIVIEGNGFKQGAKEWLKTNCKGTKVKVMDLSEFQRYIISGMPKIVPSIQNRIKNWLSG